MHLGKCSHLEAEEEGKQGSQERGVPAAVPAGCWKIHHGHAPVFHWRSEGDTPTPLSPSVPTGKWNAENCKSIRGRTAGQRTAGSVGSETSALAPSRQCRGGVLLRTPVPCFVISAQTAESQSSIFSLHPAQHVPLGIRRSFRSGLLIGRQGRKGPSRDWGPTSLGPIQNETGNQLSTATGAWAPWLPENRDSYLLFTTGCPRPGTSPETVGVR